MQAIARPLARAAAPKHVRYAGSLSAWAAVPAGPPDPILGACLFCFFALLGLWSTRSTGTEWEIVQFSPARAWGSRCPAPATFAARLDIDYKLTTGFPSAPGRVFIRVLTRAFPGRCHRGVQGGQGPAQD